MNYRQRIDRLLRILTLVQAGVPAAGSETSRPASGRGWTARTLADELGTTSRTIFRDLHHLREAGVPVAYDERSRQYAIAGPFFMPPVQLTLDESLALLGLCDHVAQREQIPFLRPAARAAHKIESQLPADLRRDLAERRGHIMIRTAAAMAPDGAADVYDKMQAALARRRLLRCRYEAASGETSEDRERRRRARDDEFDFAPYALFFCVRAWYVIGKRSDRRDLRCMKLNRFTRVQPTDSPFQFPKRFSLEKHLGNAWRMMRGKDVDVELLFDAQFADTISDTHWHRTQDFQMHADGSCTFTCTVSGLDEIVWWVLSMGPHCRVIRPAALAQRVRELAAATAAHYDARK